MIHAWASAMIDTGAASGCSATMPTATTRNGTTCAAVVSVHSFASRASLSASTRRRQWTAATSGRTSSAKARLAAGDRGAHDHQVGVDRQRAHHLGLALPGRPDAVVATVELTPERLDGRLHRVGVLLGPLGQRRVAALVHAD